MAVDIEFELSPSGIYKIEDYDDKWIVKRVCDDSVIFTRPSNDGREHWQFFLRGSEEWLYLTGKYITFQMFLNLETGQCYNNNNESHESDDNTNDFYKCHYCWGEICPNSDGTILAVSGCLWACPYEVQFFDFTDPSKGWPRMPIEDLPSGYHVDSDKINWIKFEDNEVFEHVHYEKDVLCYRIHLSHDNSVMQAKAVMRAKVVDVSEAHQQYVQKIEQEKEERTEYTKLLKTTNPNYLALRDAFDTEYDPNVRDPTTISYFWHHKPGVDLTEPLKHNPADPKDNNGCHYSLDCPPDQAPFIYYVKWKGKTYPVTCDGSKISIVKEVYPSIQACIEYIQTQ